MNGILKRIRSGLYYYRGFECERMDAQVWRARGDILGMPYSEVGSNLTELTDSIDTLYIDLGEPAEEILTQEVEE